MSGGGRRKRVRYTLDIHFSVEAEKDAFVRRLGSVRELLSGGEGVAAIDNSGLMSAMFDIVEGMAHPTPTAGNTRQMTRSFMRSNGMYSGNESPEDESMFLVERHCFGDLLEGLTSPCPCGMTRRAWALESILQKGHVIRTCFSCRRCHAEKRTWSSSRVFGGHYLANQKMVHAFTCAGILPTQYIKLSEFAGLGTVKYGLMSRVYNRSGFIELVGSSAEKSMQAAVDEVKALSEYTSSGEWVITDARHDSTANAFHTTVPCLSGSTHKILGITTLSRTNHSTAQTREYACTKLVIPQVLSRGLKVVEVAHDIQQQVSKYVTQLGLVNSFDTWHGTKNVGREMKKITQGRKRDRNKRWFPELADKPKSVKIHLYWAMKNCGNDPELLRNMIDNILCHYIGDHSGCFSNSPCKTPDYTPSKTTITNPRAAQSLMDILQDTYIYRFAESFSRCRDTFFVESFNHQLLCYLPKRIHFSTKVFEMRMNLAVLDWNENVDRPSTSEKQVKDLRRPDRRTPMKALVAKKFVFVSELWRAYVQRNQVDLRPADSESEDEDAEVGDDHTVPDGTVCCSSSDEEQYFNESDTDSDGD